MNEQESIRPAVPIPGMADDAPPDAETLREILAKYLAENPRWWAAPIRRKGYTITFTHREDPAASESLVRHLLHLAARTGAVASSVPR